MWQQTGNASNWEPTLTTAWPHTACCTQKQFHLKRKSFSKTANTKEMISFEHTTPKVSQRLHGTYLLQTDRQTDIHTYMQEHKKKKKRMEIQPQQ
jgi:hypothetical protein